MANVLPIAATHKAFLVNVFVSQGKRQFYGELTW